MDNLKKPIKTVRTAAVRVGLVLISTIVSLLVIEGVLRVAGSGTETSIFNNYRFDDVLGWDTKPSYSWASTQGPTPHTNYYNADGLPSSKRDIDRSLSVDTPTIAFVGDSFTEGYYLPYQETFTYLVGQKFPGKQILNLGVASFAPDQYLLKAKRHLPNYDVSVVIVMFFPGNDVEDVTRSLLGGYSKPYFEDSFETPLSTPPTKLTSAAEGIPRKIHRHSALVRAITPTLIEYVPWMVDFVAGSGVSASRHEEAGMTKALRLVQQIKIEFPADDFVTYYVPHLEKVQDQSLFQHNVRLYESVCGELKMRCLTLEPALALVPDLRDFFIERDGHFTRLGAKSVADQIYDDLVSANGAIGSQRP